MESLLHEHSISSRKQIKNSKRKSYHHFGNHHPQHLAARLPSISRQSSCNIVHQNYAPSPKYVQLEMVHAVNTGGVFLNHFPTNNNNNINNPFFHSNSLPPILPSFQPHHQHLKMTYHKQPPLLPLPAVSKPTFHSLPTLTRRSSLSTPVPGKQTNKKSTTQNNKKELSNNNMSNKELVAGNSTSTTKTMSKTSLLVENEGVGPTKALGTNPDSDPKEPTRVFADLNKNGVVGEVEIFCLSPPPSSLPLPKFGLLRKLQQQTKLSCQAEAAVEEVESGVATDNLCRLLKLR